MIYMEITPAFTSSARFVLSFMQGRLIKTTPSQRCKNKLYLYALEHMFTFSLKSCQDEITSPHADLDKELSPLIHHRRHSSNIYSSISCFLPRSPTAVTLFNA